MRWHTVPTVPSVVHDAGSSVAEILGDHLALAQLVRLGAHPPAVSCAIPNDDQVIACALAADAELVVSSDDDLLTLGHNGPQKPLPSAASPPAARPGA